ncbi:SDR family NAD(P)-dependent oxidoreductase [Stakelama saccharophila]|uniref:SDR family NAD(P)-dependent oxidoreductase n=1 Tax=Stakelama saccharophila TaxID=3075605 RepID=A0ABZ0B9R1_9SPHN|nr:SDR family NAD(P)-dependent oxidoreductase [Stakelama sp. W311]WNO54103.1 SDR family NAD(P)-dependent oxidoreductase [Stakelama sp. W311]
MTGLLEGKRVCVTGASAGIGRAVAIGCARHGADVAVNFGSDRQGADSAVAEIEALGRKGVAIQGDVAEPESATRFIDGAVAELGGVDIFVNNAGICPFHSFLDMPTEVFERTMRVNMHGAYFMVQAAANQMVKQGDGGSIIAMSSISALVGGEFQTHYTPTKAGVLSLMQSTAVALGKHGIRCNALLPGTILTDINKDDLADGEKREYMERRVPLGRLGRPEDMVGPTVFLASDELAGYVTGAALLVDGGMFVNLQ